MRPEARTLAIVLLLSLATLPPSTGAQEAGEPKKEWRPPGFDDPTAIHVTEDTTWGDGTVKENANYTVSENATLTIHGLVTLKNVVLRVDTNATLLVESLPGQPAVIESGDNAGWELFIIGNLTVQGLPGEEAVLRDLRGQSGFTMGTTALFVGGISIIALDFTLRHVVIEDYAAGILMGEKVGGTIQHATFRNGTGIAVAMTGGTTVVGNSTFENAGGGIFASVPPTPITFHNLTFREVPTPFTLRGAYVTLANVSMEKAGTCVNMVGYNVVTIRNLTCRDFDTAALATQTTVTNRNIASRFDVDGFEASTQDPVDGVIIGNLAQHIRIRNATIGPAPGPGILGTKVVADLDNVRFQGIGDYNVVYINPPPNSTFSFPREGEPGAKGWLRVIRQAPFRLVDADGNPVTGARFDARAMDTDVLAFSNKSLTGNVVVPALEAFTIDRRGEEREVKFHIEVANATMGATLDDYSPTANETRIVLMEGAVPEFKDPRKGVPAPGLALVALAVLAAALLARRR